MSQWLRHHVVAAMPSHLVGWVIGGAIIALSGASPDDWIARVVHATSGLLPSGWTAATSALVARSFFAVLGAAVIVSTMLRVRQRKETLANSHRKSFTPAIKAEVPVTDFPPPVQQTSPSATFAVAPRLSIVVLPFANLSGDPEQQYFVDGVTESLTTDLSRLAGSFVIGSSTAFTYKGKPTDLKQIGRELNVRYVLEGSVQRSANRIRVNIQLIDAGTGTHLWAERFDKPMGDLLDMQDEIVARLASELSTALIAQEARRAARAPNPDSLDHYFQGMAWYEKGWSPGNVAEARRCFERAVELDPTNVDALVKLANVDHIFGILFTSGDRAARFAAAEASLNKALSLAPDHAFGHYLKGVIRTFDGPAEEGIVEAVRALELDRNLARAHALIGVAKMVLGHSEETEAYVKEALRLSPKDAFAYIWMVYAGRAKLSLGADEEAVVWLRRSIEANRNYTLSHFTLAAALAHLGRLNEARAAAKAGLALDPTTTIQRLGTVHSGTHPVFTPQNQRMLEGLRIAGVPEG